MRRKKKKRNPNSFPILQKVGKITISPKNRKIKIQERKKANNCVFSEAN